MTPHYVDDSVTLYHGDALAVLAELPASSVDAVCTDPPYGLEFMGREWDRPWAVGMSKLGYSDAERMARPSFGDSRNANCRACGGRQRGERRCTCDAPEWDRHPREDMVAYAAWCQDWAAECLRVLKPGGHLLAFGGTRTWHRLTCAVEDAGFEIRDTISWLYGSGFPKSLDVSKAIDKAAGAEREVVGTYTHPDGKQRAWGDHNPQTQGYHEWNGSARSVTAPATDDARRWAGWGTALKPAHEPIVVARKPLAGTVAANVLTHGTGGLNVDGCRVAHRSQADRAESEGKNQHAARGAGPRVNHCLGDMPGDRTDYDGTDGRWPPNVVLDEAMAAELDRQSGDRPTGALRPYRRANRESYSGAMPEFSTFERLGEEGGASRFFPVFRYEPKAPTHERPRVDGEAHATVKPLGLMRWLVRLVTPPGGLVLDPFAGSGTTAEACVVEGFRCITVEKGAEYLPLIVARLTKPIQPVLEIA